MDALLTSRPASSAAALPAPSARRAIAAWTLGCAAPLYLALRGGGYEPVLRDQVGIALWWIAIAGVLAGVLPLRRPSRAQLVALGALSMFGAWSGLTALWSLNAGGSVAELSRISSYAALLCLAILVVRADTRVWLLGGLTSAIAAVALLALLSRLHPSWFPADQTARFLSGAASRLNYPLNYWNGLAAFVACGVPLAIHFAAGARRLPLRSLAAACLPAMVAVVYLTFSRGGWLELAVGLLALLALSGRRLWRAASALNGGLGALLLTAAIHQRHAIDHGLASAAAHRQGSELIAVALVVCAGVALMQGAISLLERHRSGAFSALRRRRMRPVPAPLLAGVLALAAIAAFLLAGGAHQAAHAWARFESPSMHLASGQSTTEGRLLALSGDGRWQYWLSCVSAFVSHPLGGVGAGSFALWWAAHGSIYSYVRNAHSLYFETLAETGLPGLLLLIAFLGAGLWGIVRRLRVAAGEQRAIQAAILASCLAFCCAAAFDWVWQIPAIPALLLLAIAAGCAGDARRSSASAAAAPTAPSRGPRARSSAAWIAPAALGALAIAWPMLSTVSLRESAAAAGAGRLAGALSDAGAAARAQPFASAPPLQQALVLERERKLAAASATAGRAIERARSDWRSWLVLSRIEAERGRASAALGAWRHARALDPHDPLFAQAGKPSSFSSRSRRR